MAPLPEWPTRDDAPSTRAHKLRQIVWHEVMEIRERLADDDPSEDTSRELTYYLSWLQMIETELENVVDQFQPPAHYGFGSMSMEWPELPDHSASIRASVEQADQVLRERRGGTLPPEG